MPITVTRYRKRVRSVDYFFCLGEKCVIVTVDVTFGSHDANTYVFKVNGSSAEIHWEYDDPRWLKIYFGSAKRRGYFKLGDRQIAAIAINNAVDWSVVATSEMWELTIRSSRPGRSGADLVIVDKENKIKARVLGDNRPILGKVVGNVMFDNPDALDKLRSFLDSEITAVFLMVIIADLFAVPFLGRSV
jgi:hypothetical protein